MFLLNIQDDLAHDTQLLGEVLVSLNYTTIPISLLSTSYLILAKPAPGDLLRSCQRRQRNTVIAVSGSLFALPYTIAFKDMILAIAEASLHTHIQND